MYTYVCRFYFWLSCHFVLTLNCGNALSCHAPARSQLFFSIYVSIFHQRTGSLLCAAHKNTAINIYTHINRHTHKHICIWLHTRVTLFPFQSTPAHIWRILITFVSRLTLLMHSYIREIIFHGF